MMRHPFTRLARLSLALLFLACALALHAADLWGPIVSTVTPTSIEIRWHDGDQPAKGVMLNKTLHAGVTIEGGYRAVTLDGLKPDTDYAYTFLHDDKTDAYSFHTAPNKPIDFTFAVYGDCRTGHDIHSKVVNAILALKPRFVLNSGDLVAAGKQASEWTEFFTEARPLTGNVPYFPVPGNHEQNADTFFKLFAGMPGQDPDHYVFVYGNVRVIMLDSNQLFPEQHDWLDKTLAAAKENPTAWTVVVFHHPPYTSGPHGPNEDVRKNWVPLFEQYHVDAVFLGHDHIYERSLVNGVQYFVTGGGGAPLYTPKDGVNPYQKAIAKAYHYLRVDVTAKEMRIRMFLLDGTMGDDVVLKK